MKIVAIRETTVSIASPIRNAVIDFSQMTVTLLAMVSDVIVAGRPVVGFGFNSNGRYAQGELLRERLIPRVLAAGADELCLPDGGGLDPAAVQAAALRNEKPGGHGDRAVAAGILDMAAWDLAAKLEGRPLWQVVAERTGRQPVVAPVSIYAAGGYYTPTGDYDSLVRELLGYLDLGYTEVKMKIGGAALDEDRRRIEAVLAALPAGCRLAVDANGRLSLRDSLAYADALADYDLVWFEEPCDPLDYATLATVADAYPGVLATGENLFSPGEVTNLLRYGGLRPGRDVLQMDPALSYGLTGYLVSLAELDRFGWSAARCCPHGGHQFNLHLAVALGLGGVESYPGIFQPFGGFSDGVPVEAGHIRPPTEPGIGLEAKAALRPLLDQLVG